MPTFVHYAVFPLYSMLNLHLADIDSSHCLSTKALTSVTDYYLYPTYVWYPSRIKPQLSNGFPCYCAIFICLAFITFAD